MKRKTIYDLHREAKAQIKRLEGLHQDAEDRFAREATDHHETRARMMRYQEDASSARLDYRAAVKARDEQHDRMQMLERENASMLATEAAVRDFLDGVEASIPAEKPTDYKLGDISTTTYFPPPQSQNRSITARLGFVMARVLGRKA